MKINFIYVNVEALDTHNNLIYLNRKFKRYSH
jgi:hypothetical protein